MEAGSRIKEALYLCQASFLLFASSTAPEKYKGMNFSWAVFLSPLGFELIFSRILRLSCRTSTSDPFFLTSAMTLLWLVYLLFCFHLCICGRFCLRLSSLFVCLLSIDVLVFSGYTDSSLEAKFLCVLSCCGFRFRDSNNAQFHCCVLTFRAVKS